MESLVQLMAQLGPSASSCPIARALGLTRTTRSEKSRMRRAIGVFTLSLGGIGAGPALGAGFQLNETSAAGLGNAFAGGAATAEDASTLWSTAAGTSRMPARQVLGALHLVKPSMKFSDAGSVAASQQALGGNGGDAGSLAVVPNLYLASPLGSDWSLGFGSPRLGVW